VPLSVKFSGSLVNVVELNLVLKEPETMQFGMVADHDDDAGAHERNRKYLLLAGNGRLQISSSGRKLIQH